MATIAQLVELGDSTNTTGPYTTGSFSPAIDDQIVVVASFTATTDNTLTVTESAGGGTYTLVAVQEWSGTGNRMFVYIRTALCAATTSRTISCTLPSDAATGATIQVLAVKSMGTGRAGLTAVKQSGKNKGGAASTPAVTMGAALNTNNATLIGFSNSANPPGITLPSGFSSIDTVGFASPTTGSEVSKDESGNTSTTLTWGSSSATAWGAIVVEFDQTALAVTGTVNQNLGIGAVTATGVRTVFGTVNKTLIGSLATVVGRVTRFGTVVKNLAVGAATAVGLRTVFGIVNKNLGIPGLVASGTVSGGGVTVFGTATLVIPHALTSAGLRTVLGSVNKNLTVPGVTVVGRRTVLGTVLKNLSVGAATVLGLRTVKGTVSQNITAVVTVLGVRTVKGRADVVLVDVLTAQGYITQVVMGRADLAILVAMTAQGTADQPARIVRGPEKFYSPRANTPTGFRWPVETREGVTVWAMKQYVIQVPYERRIIDTNGREWRLVDNGIVEAV